MDIEDLLRDYYREAVFILGLIGTTGSLYISFGLEWTVCTLCWVQRIFLYPISLIVGASIIAEKDKLMRYILPMSLLGGLSSVYHYSSMVLDPTQTCGLIIPCSLPNRLYFLTPLRPQTVPLSGIVIFGAISAILVYKQMIVKD